MKTLPILILVAARLAAQNYPPAQGPLSPPASDTPVTLQIRQIIDEQLRDVVSQKLNGINSSLASRSDVHAVMSATSFNPSQPYMTQTTYTDRPNSRYLLIDYTIGLTVSSIYFHTALGWLNYPWDRSIEVSVQIGVFCDRWETGVGKIVIQPKVNQPYLDTDPALSEEIVNGFLGNWLIPYVDSNIRQGLSGISVGPVTTPFSCNYLGYISGTDLNNLREGVLTFEEKQIRTTSSQSIKVKLVEVKRLVAHDTNGTPVYYPTENLLLSFYANFGGAFKALPPMMEGQTVSLASVPVSSIPFPGFGGSLTLIVSLTQNGPGSTEDSSFLMLPVTPSFVGGRQTIRTDKTYSSGISGHSGSKPILTSIEGYEVTFDISTPSLEVRQ